MLQAVLQLAFITASASIRKLERTQGNDVIMQLKYLEKNIQTQSSPRTDKVRAEINKTEARKTMQRIKKPKNWLSVVLC